MRILIADDHGVLRQGLRKSLQDELDVDGTAVKGHYRVNRSALNRYLESKKVMPSTALPKNAPRTRRFPQVENHLGL